MHAPSASPQLIARVEPLTLTRNVRGPFDYRLRPEQSDVAVGALLRVPFGGRTMLGVVLGLATETEIAPDRLAEPDAVLPPGVPADLVELAAWIAEQYCSTPARALTLVLPPGAAGGARRKRVLVAELTDAGAQALGDGATLTDRQRTALEALERDGPAVAATLGTPTLRRLETRGLVRLESSTRARRPASVAIGRRLDGAPELTGEQRDALDAVLSAGGDAPRRFLLHGVTGSGKTEVYLRAVQETLAAGRGAIVLVPEIALTPQTVGRFQARFGDVVAVLHSGLGQGERHDEWLRLRSGEARVCVGPRSAVFAPLADIGLIVVDEEHDASYKHEGDPRYDARTVAVRRAEQHNAIVLAGSATPRPESVVALRRLRLRAADRSAAAAAGRGGRHARRPPSPPPADPDGAGRRTPRRRQGDRPAQPARLVELPLLPRLWTRVDVPELRGCARSPPGPGPARVPSLRPPSPGAQPLRGVRIGRRRPPRRGHRERRAGAARSVRRRPSEVFRLDADVAAGKDRLAQTLGAFEAAEAGVLVGTQMVAKGHDFDGVTLGVVLDADQTLRFPDFRAEERTFALVTQLAGRVGRGGDNSPSAPPARVLVQTLAPTASSLAFAAQHDSDGFVEAELARRRVLGYPPFGSLIRIVCSSPDASEAAAVAVRLQGLIVPAGENVLGPAPLFRLRGRSRSQLVIKCRDRQAAVLAVGAAVDQCATDAGRRGVSVSVDVDPQ